MFLFVVGWLWVCFGFVLFVCLFFVFVYCVSCDFFVLDFGCFISFSILFGLSVGSAIGVVRLAPSCLALPKVPCSPPNWEVTVHLYPPQVSARRDKCTSVPIPSRPLPPAIGMSIVAMVYEFVFIYMCLDYFLWVYPVAVFWLFVVNICI